MKNGNVKMGGCATGRCVDTRVERLPLKTAPVRAIREKVMMEHLFLIGNDMKLRHIHNRVEAEPVYLWCELSTLNLGQKDWNVQRCRLPLQILDIRRALDRSKSAEATSISLIHRWHSSPLFSPSEQPWCRMFRGHLIRIDLVADNHPYILINNGQGAFEGQYPSLLDGHVRRLRFTPQTMSETRKTHRDMNQWSKTRLYLLTHLVIDWLCRFVYSYLAFGKSND